MIKIYQGDALHVLPSLPPSSVDMVMTSPPYYKKRINGGYPGEIGNEPTIQEYVGKLKLVFAEVKRVLKPAGSVWVNIGDSYNTAKVGYTDGMTEHKSSISVSSQARQAQAQLVKLVQADIPAHSMQLIASRFAIMMVDELGFCLRNTIIWNKPNAKPDGNAARRRFGNSTEMLYWFTKTSNGDYYFVDQREPCKSRESELRRHPTTVTVFSGKNKHRGYGNRTYSGKVWKPR